jgi:hypothetical protein
VVVVLLIVVLRAVKFNRQVEQRDGRTIAATYVEEA